MDDPYRGYRDGRGPALSEPKAIVNPVPIAVCEEGAIDFRGPVGGNLALLLNYKTQQVGGKNTRPVVELLSIVNVDTVAGVYVPTTVMAAWVDPDEIGGGQQVTPALIESAYVVAGRRITVVAPQIATEVSALLGPIGRSPKRPSARPGYMALFVFAATQAAGSTVQSFASISVTWEPGGQRGWG